MEKGEGMLSVEEMRALELNSQYFGVSRLKLMENAGKGVADAISQKFNPKNLKVKIFSGLGGNGGDGFVAARYLAAAGADVEVILLGDPGRISSKEARENWDLLKKLGCARLTCLRESSELGQLDADVIVDAILGTGLKTQLRGLFWEAVEAINRSGAFKVAIDVPTGIDSDTGEVMGVAVRADLTLTLHDLKIGMPKAKECGEIVVVDIGIPEKALTHAGPGDVHIAIKDRAPGSHKGDFGRLLVVGGCPRYVGAPALVALGALRAGVDLAIVAAPEKVAWAINAISPDIITVKLPCEVISSKVLEQLGEEIRNSSGIVLGPGMGNKPETLMAVPKIIRLAGEAKVPVVVDADAIKALSKDPSAMRDANCVVTPHGGEFKILTGAELPEEINARAEVAKQHAKSLGATILLKGNVDIIASPDGKVKLNSTGNPGMTVGGTGDVLSGILGALLAQGSDPFKAAVAAAFINGYAGDLAAQEKGFQLVASDLLDKIPSVIREIKNQTVCITPLNQN